MLDVRLALFFISIHYMENKQPLKQASHFREVKVLPCRVQKFNKSLRALHQQSTHSDILVSRNVV